MFTGLVETTGRIESMDGTREGRRLVVRTPLAAELTPGDSIAVNGVCLTVTSASDSAFSADVAPATLAVTSFGTMTAGRAVNLERPLRADALLGGHFVLGHVDAVGRIETWREDGDAHWLDVGIPESLEPLVVPKGSIAIDGISLTIASIAPGRIGVQIVPFTRAHTTLAAARVGDTVNLEADVLGKYVARLIAHERAAAPVLSPMEP